MSQEVTAQLVKFVYEAFGAQFAALLLVGLDEEPAQGTKKFYVLENEEDEEQSWEIEVEVVGGALPYRSEPLILAALLKILVGRKGVPDLLEFQMGAVENELRQAGVTLTRERIDRIISKYVALFYHKRPRQGDESDEGGGGVYSLITAYYRDSVNKADGTGSRRIFNSVQFDPRFVAALRNDEIIFAGIRFGRLGQIAA